MATSSARIYTSSEARSSILKRGLIEDTTVPPHVQARIDEMFGEPTTPVQCVQNILRSVREKGDDAVQYWTKTIDGVDISAGAEVSFDTIQNSLKSVSPDVIEALRISRDRIVTFHKKQPVSSWFTNELGGMVGQAIRPIERVGFYVPGGTAPLPSTVLMSVLPAVVAGCEQFVVVSPPDRQSASIASVTLAACAVINELGGVKVRVFTVGGSQAVGALAYGTATIPQVDKIVGPGNIFVAIAKKEVFGVVGIDGIYGPTEAVVLADQQADPKLVAADLLAQAEHDFMAVPILLTDSKTLAEKVQNEVDIQIEQLDRKEVAKHSMEHQGGLVVAESLDECVDLANAFATEHVSLSVEKPWDLVGKMKNAGGLFLGEGSCEVLGDYIAGPSHVMPTGGSARFSSPLSVLDFVKIVSVVGLDAPAVREIAGHAEKVARAEGLDGHANAAKMRKQFEL
ncbi:Histidinol dehydrogenase [Gracilariopsis chorda]|uniref:Histidinol dehydrogenase n=1 Tax=Gracilariopsis chorda TaxID=448386 RepID=A0A2V3IPS2_9FLOR|nr:Histidinol dehydrogenase [Gracilariopsis chorda]|eukprot:PXF44085.1 Histidinol dehydrogenase [Gracilariopsis chorda]